MKYLKKYKNLLIVIVIVSLIIVVYFFKRSKDNVKKDSLSGNISNYEYTFYNFTLEGCVACEQMDEIYNSLSQKYIDKLNFKIINVDKEIYLTNKYNINLVPTFIIIDKNGNVIKRVVGISTFEDVEKLIESVITR